MGKLTALAVKAATKPGRYQDGKGLMLIVKDSGGRFWVLRIQAAGKRRDIGLGSAADTTLAVARDKADEIRRLYRAGSDPLAEKHAAKPGDCGYPDIPRRRDYRSQRTQGRMAQCETSRGLALEP
jgi:Arm DNA-binding domain